MYCPQCAAQNVEGAKFCRACGADIRLVPQALRGNLPSGVEQARAEIKREMRKHKKKQPPRIDQGVQDIFKGIGFLCVFIIGMLAFRGAFWWTIWFVIPAFKNIGEGIGEIVRARQQQQSQLTSAPAPQALGHAQPAPALERAPRLNHLSTPDTAEMLPTAPASVTEMTTRHLDAPTERGVNDA